MFISWLKEMDEKYSVINIRSFIDKSDPAYIGEEQLSEILNEFSCPINPDVEHFLLHNAIEFTKKDQSVTYLVFTQDKAELAGYFSVAIKPISILASSLSKNMCKKISRVAVLDETTNTYTASAYLIAQLGKNFALPNELRIEGNALLDFALNNVLLARYYWGGVVEFLECEDKEPLLRFYMNNGFKVFNSRITKDKVKLYQLLKFI